MAATVASAQTGAAPSRPDPVASLENDFEKKYPKAETLVLSDPWMAENGISIADLRDRSGWEKLSNAIYGTEKFADALRKMNKNAWSPMSTNNFIRQVFCDHISDKYCSPVINIRTVSLKAEREVENGQEPEKPEVQLEKRETRPQVRQAPAKPAEPSAEPERGKTSIVIDPRSVQAGTQGRLRIAVKGEFNLIGVAKARVSSSSGAVLFNDAVDDIDPDTGRAVFVPLDLADAEPGTYTVTLMVQTPDQGDVVVGTSRLTVEPAE